jgi:hypothetical protein
MVISPFDCCDVGNFNVASGRFSEKQWTSTLGQKRNLKMPAETDL